MKHAITITALALLGLPVGAAQAQSAASPAPLPGTAASCEGQATLMCVEERCSCVPGAAPGAPSDPGPQCMLIVGYGESAPHQPWIRFPAGLECAEKADVALAVALAALLRASGPVTPMPKPTPRK